jgi:hypothetical protein
VPSKAAKYGEIYPFIYPDLIGIAFIKKGLREKATETIKHKKKKEETTEATFIVGSSHSSEFQHYNYRTCTQRHFN